MAPKHLFVALMVYLIHYTKTAENSPKCRYYYPGGFIYGRERFAVMCTKQVGKSLRFLNELPDNVTDIVVTNSNINILKFGLMPTYLTSLLSIKFNKCNIRYIHVEQNTHPEFIDVQHISLSSNHIDIIRKNTFGQFPNVEHIDLDHNKVKKVYQDAFRDLLSLRTINLSSNRLVEIQNRSFKNIPQLQWLDLSSNRKLKPFHYDDTSKPHIIFSNTESKETPVDTYLTSLQKLLYFLIPERPIREWLGGYFLYIVSGYICLSIGLTLGGIMGTHEGRQQLIWYLSQRHIGQITLGGPMGDNVLTGTLGDNRKVAIKKIYKASKSQFRKELEILLKMSRVQTNPHVVQYICKEEDENHLYIALELCDMNLEKAIRTKEKIRSTLTVNKCLQQIADGLRHIHKHGIQHRDIKPKNILLKERDSIVTFVISDFDLGHHGKDSSDHKIPHGTKGWAAPELRAREERTTAVDIFSLGCVFYYVLSKGCHPFGPTNNLEKCQQAICDDKEPNLENLKVEGETSGLKVTLAKDLIVSMLQHDHKKRPKARWVLQHPLFWSDERTSKFYHDIGKLAVDKDHETFQEMLRANSSEVFTGRWVTYLDEVVKRDVNKKFDILDICKLLRTIRNKAEHFEGSSEELKYTLYGSSEGVARYFNEKFPRLLLYTFYTKEKFEVQRQATN